MPKLLIVNQEPRIYAIRFLPGEKIQNSLSQIILENDISSAYYTAVGSLKDPELAIYDPYHKVMKHKTFQGHYEVASLKGNLSYIYAEPTPVLHTHVILFRDDHQPIAGHLIEAEVSVTLEMFLYQFSIKLERKYDENYKLFLWDI